MPGEIDRSVSGSLRLSSTIRSSRSVYDNLQEWRLSYLTEETQKRLRAKYAYARGQLQAVLP